MIYHCGPQHVRPSWPCPLLWQFLTMFLDSSGYEEAERKSHYIVQYKCCGNTWWGTSKNTCRRCKKSGKVVPFNAMIGIGWFTCVCGRKFAGFCRGGTCLLYYIISLTKQDVTSKCHGCNTECFADFIVPGEKASGKGGKSHYCAKCRGSLGCPIVNAAKNYYWLGINKLRLLGKFHILTAIEYLLELFNLKLSNCFLFEISRG